MFSKNVISVSSNILDALKLLNNLSDGGLTIFVIDNDKRVVGSITDGDIRRWLINGGLLTDAVVVAMHRDFKYFTDSEVNDVRRFKELKQKGVSLIPILNDKQQLLSIVDLRAKRSMLPIDAVLMAGGKGERLRPLTNTTPKPLLKVGDKAIIDYNIERLTSFGVNNISVTINYLKEQLEEHFEKPINGVKVNCVREPKFLGTMGSITFVESFYNDTVLVMNSDLFTNINYEEFFLHFKEHNADLSAAAVPYPITVPYGIFELEGRDIVGLREKPTYNHYANAGIYLIKKELLNIIPGGEFFNATDFIELLISKNKKVVRFPITGYWLDIGKHEEYNKANELIEHYEKY